MLNVLIIDDDLAAFRPGVEQALKGHRLHFAYSGEDGIRVLEENPKIDVVLLDIVMPPKFASSESREGVEVLRRIHERWPSVPVVMLTVLSDIDLVVECIQEGAFHYVAKPPERDKLRDAVTRAAETSLLKSKVRELAETRDALTNVYTTKGSERDRLHGLIGSHPLMRQLYDQIELAASYERMSVIFLGETGTGKGVAARALHACSSRAKRPFVSIACTAIPETMLESQLFGHEKGAYTDAQEAREGFFVEANGGTLFLDEIGDMPLSMQAKLLQVLESGEVRPVGGKPRPVDVRVVFATRRDLAAAVEAGTFRDDLYFRIWKLPLRLPSLKERLDDIPLLSKHFLEAFERAEGVRRNLSDEVFGIFRGYSWPGNVRELENLVERMGVKAIGGTIDTAVARQIPELFNGEPPPPCPTEVVEPAIPVSASETIEPCAAAQPDTTESGYPDLSNWAEYVQDHGKEKFGEVIKAATNEAGSFKKASVLLGVPESSWRSFERFVRRKGLMPQSK